MAKQFGKWFTAVGAFALFIGCSGDATRRDIARNVEPSSANQIQSVELQPCELDNGEPALCGTYEVFEDRSSMSGRMLSLKIVVLPARTDSPEPDPVFFVAGGPGQAATGQAHWFTDTVFRANRDVVFVDQRGTGDGHYLQCRFSGSDESPEGYMESVWDPESFAECARELAQNFDLTKYTTDIAMDDLNEVRIAMGYDQINLVGGSYGTRASMVFMRRHGEHVRSAVLNGTAPMEFKNPLFHARAAQEALDRVLEMCALDPACNEAFPNVATKFEQVLARVEREPVEVTFQPEGIDRPLTAKLGRYEFASALRVMMYGTEGALSAPFLIDRAASGDFAPFAETVFFSNRGIRDALAWGMLLCVVCNEDVARIREDEIEAATNGTYLGDRRVREQMAVCDVWPKAAVHAGYGDPVISDVPTLVLSGEIDPVTSAYWGQVTSDNLANSQHLIFPSAHFVFGPCADDITLQFVNSGSVEGLNTECMSDVKYPPFRLR